MLQRVLTSPRLPSRLALAARSDSGTGSGSLEGRGSPPARFPPPRRYVSSQHRFRQIHLSSMVDVSEIQRWVQPSSTTRLHVAFSGLETRRR